MTHRTAVAAIFAAALSPSASAQSLLETPPEPPPARGTEATAVGDTLQTHSLFVVTPPKPKIYAKHDLVEVIINESSVQNFQQSLDSKKDYDFTAELKKFPSLKALFEDATLEEGIGNVKPGVSVTTKNKFKGEGTAKRSDRITARITATVVDVKPNGTLVLEARETIQSDKETSTMVLTGTARNEDITRSNTVQSSQLANLSLKIEHSGEVKDSSTKGIIPRVFEAIFNF
jgi:flagellar L-ring protein FlgH